MIIDTENGVGSCCPTTKQPDRIKMKHLKHFPSIKKFSKCTFNCLSEISIIGLYFDILLDSYSH